MGESVYKVGKKVFVFLGVGDEGHLTVKLNDRRDEAMAFESSAGSRKATGS